MKIVLPADSTHSITFIPRYYPDNVLVLSLTNEATDLIETPANTFKVVDGEMTITFDYTFVERDKRSIKITEGTNVIYRGKLEATAQTPQEFKLTDGYYL
jgi:hypothetical protein